MRSCSEPERPLGYGGFGSVSLVVRERGALLQSELGHLGIGASCDRPDHVERKEPQPNPRCHYERRDAAGFQSRCSEAIHRSALARDGSIGIPSDLGTASAVRAIAECDIVFGCMDGAEGRHLLNRIATFYLLPYFDLGVRLDADGHGGVEQVCGTVHYLQPGGSSLLSRGVFTLEEVRAEGLKRTDPDVYRGRFGRNTLLGFLKIGQR